MMDYSRIEEAVDVQHLHQTTIVVVGAGGSYSFVTSLARMGVGNIIVLDFDTVEASNIVRQGYEQSDIGQYKVDALGKAVRRINPYTNYRGITKNFHDMNKTELDKIFKGADLLCFLTDSFKAQAFGNVLALRYNKPAIWAGWYAKSRTAELFFQFPKVTPACFRCCMSSRYIANEKKEVEISSNCNTIFHSQLLDSLIGFVAISILHQNHFEKISAEIHGAPIHLVPKKNESFYLLHSLTRGSDTIDNNFFQFKAHPLGGNKLFKTAFGSLGMSTNSFVSFWQEIEAEIPKNGYELCPDCNGILHELCNS